MTKKKKVPKVPRDSIGRPIVPGMKKQPAQFDFVGRDLLWGEPEIRYIIQRPCSIPGKEHLWVGRPTRARDASEDREFTTEEIEQALGEKLASVSIYERRSTGQACFH